LTSRRSLLGRLVGPRGAALALGASLVCSAGTACAEDADPWFGKDKALHFGVSVALAGGGYGASALVLDRPWERAVAGGTFSLALGAGKELYDLSGHGDPSWRDFTWDVVGTAVGLGLALLVDAAVSSAKEKPEVRAGGLSLRF
jgi:putative lipoprotein